jgi:hypothetical protein
LFNSAPTTVIDNTAFDLVSADRTAYLGNIEIDTPVDLGSTLYMQKDSVGMLCKLLSGSTTLYGILQTMGGYTPTPSASKTIAFHTLEV